MGIANAVAIARSNVPRAIAGLKDQGLLIERQAHVSGVSRERKAYFLTDPGMNVAEDTWERLRNFQLRSIMNEGSIINSTLGEINDHLDFSMRPVDIIRYMDDNCVLDTLIVSRLGRKRPFEACRKAIGHLTRRFTSSSALLWSRKGTR